MTDNDSDTQAAVEAGAAAAKLSDRMATVTLDTSSPVPSVPLVLIGSDQQLVVPRELLDVLDSRAAAPRRRKGTATHLTLKSFIAHTLRMANGHSTVWANPSGFELQAVFDYHPSNTKVDAAWGQHRAQYTCPRSPEWQLWSKAEGRDFSQDEFAQLIEDQAEQIVGGEGYPTSAELLEMALDLRVHSKGQFQRKVDPTTGQYALVCKDEHEQQSSTKIPRAFRLGLRVFDGGDVYSVEARVRFRLHNSTPVFSFQLHRRAEIERDAFSAVTAQVAEETKLPVFVGQPER